MFSVRITTTRHGDTYVHMCLVIAAVSGLLAWQLGRDYLTIYLASGLLVTVIEVGLALTGVRQGTTFVRGHRLPRVADAVLHGFVDGPGFCVPAFFVADQVLAGRYAVGIGGAGLLVFLASSYMGLADWWHLRHLPPDESPVVSRRAMTRPGAVMLLALINTVCLAATLLVPRAYLAHVLVYLGAYALMVMLFYWINYTLGVRRVELYDHEQEAFTTPGPLWQIAGLTYDSAYEMALLLSPAYWVPLYLGLLELPGLG